MQKVISTTVYTFDELSEAAKEKARDWYREGNNDDTFWSETVIDDAKTIGALIGIDIKNVWFSGFWSQGDGATFDASFNYVEGGATKVKEYAPKDEVLHAIVNDWQVLQDKEKLSGNVKQQGRYNHSQCNRVYAHSSDDVYEFDTDDSYVRDNQEPGAEATRILRRFMDWIYKQLEIAYECENSNETVDENIIANEYTFTESGKRFG